MDGAFVKGPVYKENILAKEFVYEELVVITSSKHERIDSQRNLENSTFITFSNGYSYRAFWEHWWHEDDVQLQKRMEFGTLDGIIGCVAAGLGVTLLPRAIAQKYMDTQSLSLHILATKQAQIPTWFIYRNDEVQPPALKYLIEIIDAMTTRRFEEAIHLFDSSIRLLTVLSIFWSDYPSF